MGLTNLHYKFLALLLLASLGVSAQTTVIPDKLRIKNVPRSPAIGDRMVTIDTLGNIKKDTIPSGGGGSATGVNGLTGTGNIGLGGVLTQHTTITTGGFNWIFNNATIGGNNILKLQSSGIDKTIFDIAGNIHANGIKQLNDPTNGVIDLSGGSISIYRDKADSAGILTVYQHNTNGKGDIVHFNNTAYSMFSLTGYGTITHTPIAKSIAGTAIGYSMVGALRPSANGDVLVGMDLHPTFGTSTVTGIGTIVGGSGYPDGTRLSNVSGGTGKQAIIQVIISGGVVTSASIVDGGVNYTNGDVLGIVITDSSGNPIGSGGSVTVTSVTSYTGTVPLAMRTWGVDEYGADYSSQFDANSKVSKLYVDNRVISGTYSHSASATTTFTVSIGSTQPNNTYKVNVTPTNALGSTAGFYVTNKTTTTFDVVYPSGLTGTLQFDWSVQK